MASSRTIERTWARSETTDAKANRAEPGLQHPAAPECVGEPPAGLQEPTEHGAIGRDNVIRAHVGHLQTALDGWQGEVHDGDVEEDHELAQANEGQDRPGTETRPGSGPVVDRAETCQYPPPAPRESIG